MSPQDVYALGVLLWEMLAGEVPWAAASMFHIAYAVCVLGQRPSRAAIVPPGRCPDKLWALISACWDADPQVSARARVHTCHVCARVRASRVHLTALSYHLLGRRPSGQWAGAGGGRHGHVCTRATCTREGRAGRGHPVREHSKSLPHMHRHKHVQRLKLHREQHLQHLAVATLACRVMGRRALLPARTAMKETSVSWTRSGVLRG